MKKTSYFIAYCLILAASLAIHDARAQVQNQPWKVLSNILQPVVGTWQLQIPKLGSGTTTCLTASSVGVFGTTTCGGGSSFSTNPFQATFFQATSSVSTSTFPIASSTRFYASTSISIATTSTTNALNIKGTESITNTTNPDPNSFSHLIDFNGGYLNSAFSISYQPNGSNPYYHLDNGSNSDIAIGSGNDSGNPELTIDGINGSFVVGSDCGYGAFLGGTIRTSAVSACLFGQDGTSLTVGDGSGDIFINPGGADNPLQIDDNGDGRVNLSVAGSGTFSLFNGGMNFFVPNITPYNPGFYVDTAGNMAMAYGDDSQGVTMAPDQINIFTTNDGAGINFNSGGPLSFGSSNGEAVNINSSDAINLGTGDSQTINANAPIGITDENNVGTNIGSIYATSGGGSDAMLFGVGNPESGFMAIQPHIGLSSGVGFSSIVSDNSSNDQFEIRASQILFNTAVSGPGNDRIGVNQASPVTLFDVNGDITDENVKNAKVVGTNSSGTFISVATSSLGLSSIASSSQTFGYKYIVDSTTAGIVTKYTPTATSTYSAACDVNITAIVTDVAQCQLSYTDETNTVVTENFFGMGLTSANLTSTGRTDFPPFGFFRSAANKTITVSVVLTTSIGSITYSAGGLISQISAN